MLGENQNTPPTAKPVPFYRHQLTTQHGQAMLDVIQSPMLTTGAVGKKVEADLAAYFGVAHASLVNSWTNGAIAVLMAMGIGAGDEVIVPAMTFIASANVAELLGAKPVFVDVEPDTLLIDQAKVKAALTPRTRAIIPVHLYGQMVDIKALRDVVGADVRIIEDCAHCFEGKLDGRRPGVYSDCAIFSFYATKNVTCGEGGAVISNDSSLIQKLAVTRLHGMSAGAIDRFQSGTYNHWDMVQLGMKANLPDLLAALLPSQIAEIDGKLPDRERLARRYETAFSGNPLIRLPRNLPNGTHARHLFVMAVPADMRDPLLTFLGKAKIGCTVNYRNVPTLKYYREKYGYTRGHFPVSAAWGDGTLTLPLFPGLTDEEQDWVIAAVKEGIAALNTIQQNTQTGEAA